MKYIITFLCCKEKDDKVIFKITDKMRSLCKHKKQWWNVSLLSFVLINENNAYETKDTFE